LYGKNRPTRYFVNTLYDMFVIKLGP